MLNNKLAIRKKAMDLEMKGNPSFTVQKRPKPGAPHPMEGSPAEESAESPGEESHEQEGFESFMVSPEEKDMILALRKKSGVGGDEHSEGDEGLAGLGA